MINAGRLISPSLDFLKFGAGVKYLLPRKDAGTFEVTVNGVAKKEVSIDNKLSYLPIYFTLQANPFVKSDKESLKGIFVKGDIGYNAYFSSNLKNTTDVDSDGDGIKQSVKDNGDLYYALGAGYEFPFGLVFDITYGIYKSSYKYVNTLISSNVAERELNKGKVDFTYSCVAINVGYKFKI